MIRTKIPALAVLLWLLSVSCATQSGLKNETIPKMGPPIPQKNTESDSTRPTPGSQTQRSLQPPASEAAAVRRADIRARIARMSLRQKIGQLLMISVSDPASGRDLSSVNERFRRVFRTVQPGGIVLFGQNMNTVEQTVSLIRSLQGLSTTPLFVATDEEGGTVSRLSFSGKIPATPIPSAWKIGETRRPKLAYEAGKVIGQEIKALGFNMDLAPVADVLTNPKNTVIGTRAFGDNPILVSEMVAEMVRGIQDAGVAAVLKHFPGHGDTTADTHQTEAVVPYGLHHLERVELRPFESGIDAGADGVMVAHVELPEITGKPVPASLSAPIVEGLLRDRLRFDGVVLTDAMNMAAITQYVSSSVAAVDAVAAGCDIVLMPPDVSGAFNALLSAVHAGRISEGRIDASVQRILALKYRLGLLRAGQHASPARADAVLGSPAHLAVARQIRDLDEDVRH